LNLSAAVEQLVSGVSDLPFVLPEFAGRLATACARHIKPIEVVFANLTPFSESRTGSRLTNAMSMTLPK
jgi:hypothetical protein